MKCNILFYNRLNFLIREKFHLLNPMTKEMNPSSFNFLVFLYQSKSHELSLKNIENELQQSQSSINEISLELEKLGYIERFKDPEDKRRLKARLTTCGIDYAQKREEEFKREEDYLLSGISPEEKEVYIKVAKTMYQNALSLLKNKDKYQDFLVD